MNGKLIITLMKHSSAVLKNCSTWAPYLCSGAAIQKVYPSRKFSTTAVYHTEEAPDEFDSFEDLRAVAGDDPEKLSAVDEIIREIDTFTCSLDVFQYPSQMTAKHWQHLLTLGTRRERLSYYRRLHRREIVRKCKDKVKEAKRSVQSPLPDTPVKKNRTTGDPLVYRIRANSLLQLYGAKQMHAIADRKIANAIIHGPHLVIDCNNDYESRMTDHEVYLCARQLVSTRSINRMCSDPFDIVHCNFNPSGRVATVVQNFLPNWQKPEAFFNYSEKNYLELFPVNQLVYLSPHSDYELEYYDPKCIYIIGAMVDLIVQDPISMNRAKRDGLRTAKLPLDLHLNWCKGTQLLALNRVVAIMREMKSGTSWLHAFNEHIPRRKLTFNFINTAMFAAEDDPDKLSTKHLYSKYYYQHLLKNKDDTATEDLEKQKLNADLADHKKKS